MTDQEMSSLVLAASIQNLTNAATDASEYLDRLVIDAKEKADPLALDLTLRLKSTIKDIEEIFNLPSPLDLEDGESE